MKILVTGASGFVGSALLGTLSAEPQRQLVAATRSGAMASSPGVACLRVGDLGPTLDWRSALSGVHTIVHLAARVHVMRDAVADPLAEFRRVNVEGTLNLARQAAAAGAKRFIYVSSIKVNGEATAPGRPFTSRDRAAPCDAYGVSKHEAEQGLDALGAQVGMTVVTVRPPLVYGPGVRANFLRLMVLIDRRIPLPLGGVTNARSLVSVWNLCDLIRTLIDAPSLRSGVYLASDGEDLSTPSLIRRIANLMRRPGRLFSIPVPMLEALARLVGKAEEIGRLCDSLAVDISATRHELNWAPPMSVDESLHRTVQWYLREGRASGR
jgi:nucleoside-diphosphate-sugar epimerase